MDQRNIIIGVILLLLLLASNFLLTDDDDQPAVANVEEHKIDYFVNNFTTIQTDEEGRPHRRLIAKRMVHYPDDDSTELEAPFITMYDMETTKWKIRSENGWLSGDGELLLLQGKVTLDRPKTETQEPTRIITSNLRVHSEQDYAETEEDITIETPDTRIKSKGMKAWLNDPMRIKFISNVRGRYEVK